MVFSMFIKLMCQLDIETRFCPVAFRSVEGKVKDKSRVKSMVKSTVNFREKSTVNSRLKERVNSRLRVSQG